MFYLSRHILFTLCGFCLLCFNARSQSGNYKSFETYLGDTINRVDLNNVKQGRWVLFGKDKKGIKNQVLKHNQIAEEGIYLNGKKQGLWKTYHFQTNKLGSEITYNKDYTEGKAKFYTEEGKLKEECTLKHNKRIGEYFIYDAKGNQFKKTAWPANIPKNSYLAFSGTVLKNGKAFDGVRLSVLWNDLVVEQIELPESGTFTTLLELNNEYILRFSRPAYSTQSLLINTTVVSLNDSAVYELTGWKVNMYENSAAMATNELVGFLLNKPSDRIYFNPKKKVFIADGAYANLFKKQLNDISETTKILLAAAAEDNKKLEIEKLRMEADNKIKEIELLRKSKELQDAELNRKEMEIMAQKLETDKQQQSLVLLEKEKQIKELKFKHQEAALVQQQLEAERKAREIERLNMSKQLQEMELLSKDKKLVKVNSQLDQQKMDAALKAKEYDILNREKLLSEKEFNQELDKSKRELTYTLLGLVAILVFSFFLYRNYSLKKKANITLSKQAEEISRQKNEIEEKSRVIEEKNIETSQSITYAQRIQQAMLPPAEAIKKMFQQSFILYKSKDIVSGDFYFFDQPELPAKENSTGTNPVVLAAVDCTGHGVPGAFMSMIGSEKLHSAVKKTTEPSDILRVLNNGVKTALRQSEHDSSTRDGMDIALCTFDPDNNKLVYSGANRPLWIIPHQQKEIIEVKATKNSIAGFTAYDHCFEQHEINYKSGDTFYFFTDGYADQFGGTNKKKLMTKRFKEILLSIQDQSMTQQGAYLDKFIEEWKGDQEQIDDILVIGVRV